MVNSSDSLTAYKCNFEYLKRNNPMKEELGEKIISGKPNCTFKSYICKFCEFTEKYINNTNKEKVVLLSENQVKKRENNPNFWILRVNAGRQGSPVTVIKKNTGKKYEFNNETAALYENIIFVYDMIDYFIVIFHRHNRSGCKTVFLDTWNEMLKNEGVKLVMDLIVPLVQNNSNLNITKLELNALKPTIHSDDADNIDPDKRKCVTVKKLTLNLVAGANFKIKNLIKNSILFKNSKDMLFAFLKPEIHDLDDYNQVKVSVKIGKRTKTFNWTDFEALIGVNDITERLNVLYHNNNDYIKSLTILSDEYFNEIKCEIERGN